MGWMKRKKRANQYREPTAAADIPAPLRVACPYCNAAIGEPCVTDSGHETEPHSARLKEFEANAQ